MTPRLAKSPDLPQSPAPSQERLPWDRRSKPPGPSTVWHLPGSKKGRPVVNLGIPPWDPGEDQEISYEPWGGNG